MAPEWPGPGEVHMQRPEAPGPLPVTRPCILLTGHAAPQGSRFQQNENVHLKAEIFHIHKVLNRKKGLALGALGKGLLGEFWSG